MTNVKPHSSRGNPATPLDRAVWLVEKLGGTSSSRVGMCCCPAHDDENPSLEVSLSEFTEKGQPLFTCRAGCEQRAVVAAMRARGAWPIPGTLPHISDTVRIEYRTPKERRQYALRIYKSVKRQRWDMELMQDYFRRRRIKKIPRNAWLTIPWARMSTRDQLLSHDPGIVFPVHDRDDKFLGVHVIWLNGDLTGKREAEPRRQSYGPIKGGFVLLGEFDPEQPLIVAEGIETALAVMQITGLPCGLVGCGAITADMDVPPHDDVIIAADNGKAGQKTATTLARRLAGANCIVRIATPKRPKGGKQGYDWNDALMDGTDLAQMRDAILDAPEFDDEDEASDDDNDVCRS